MIRAEIRFKNAAFISALKSSGYGSIANLSRQSGLNYYSLLDYANLKTIFEDDDIRQRLIRLLDSDEWTLFEQYREVVEKENGINKISTDIPVEKMISLESNSLLMLESPDTIDEGLIEESLEIDVAFALDTLKDREKEVLKMYFGIGGEEQMELHEIGVKFGLSRERVRQIKEKAVRRLRHRTVSRKLRPYVGHNKLKRLSREWKEEQQRRDEYMRCNRPNWSERTELERTKPWNKEIK